MLTKAKKKTRGSDSPDKLGINILARLLPSQTGGDCITMRLLWRSFQGLAKSRNRRLLATTTTRWSSRHQEEREQRQDRQWSHPDSRLEQLLYATYWAGGLALAYHWLGPNRTDLLAKEAPPGKEDPEEAARLWHVTVRGDLPTYKPAQVEGHNSAEARIWVTYGLGVYDVTDFAENHPGGDKIMMAAGSAIDPFWAIYQQHNTLEVLELLEGFRIGNLEGGLAESNVEDELGSPWAQEPQRHALLKPASKRPFNAEPPIGMLAENFLTPNELFYVRNHLPVPVIREEEYELEIETGCAKPPLTLTLAGIRALPKHSVTAAIMCGGNRRSEMTKFKAVKGEWNS